MSSKTPQDNVVPVPNPQEPPIHEIPERYQLGTLVQRFRTNAGYTTSALAEGIGVDAGLLEKVESHDAPLTAQTIMDIAAFLKVRWEPLLEAASAFHRAIWKEGGNTGGVQLSDMDTQVKSLRDPLPADAEKALIKSADEFLFLHNVLKEASEKALQNAVQVRQVLAEHGVIEADAPMEVFSDPVLCSECDAYLNLNTMDVIAFVSDETGEKVYFCDRTCADSWAEKGQGRGR